MNRPKDGPGLRPSSTRFRRRRRQRVPSRRKGDGCPWPSPGKDCAPLAWTKPLSPHFRRNFVKEWWRDPRCLATLVPIIPTIGWAGWPAQISMRSSFSLLAMFRNASEVLRSTRLFWRGLHPWKFFRHSIWTPPLHTTTRMITSAIAIGLPSLRSRAPASSQRLAPAATSRPANSSSAIRTRTDRRSDCHSPNFLSRNGTYMAYRRLQEHVGTFREFLRQNGKTPEEEEWVAAKLMGRWRSGAPLMFAPDKDDPGSRQ